MNVWAALAQPLVRRPGDALDEPKARPPYRPTGRRLNDLPEVPNRWRLTPCQAECIRLVATGMTNEDVAQHLGLSCKTVEQHCRNLMERMSAHEGVVVNRVRAAVLWDRFQREQAGNDTNSRRAA